jgi:DHA1 family tetracycline resistance protein-like MFS transporter
MVGVTMAIIGVCTMVAQGALIAWFVKRFGERAALFWGLLFGALGFAIFGIAPTGYWFWAGIPVLAVWGFASAAVLALMSRHVSEYEQGRLQGANASLMGIASMVGPLVFTLSYAYAIDPRHALDLPGTPFFLAAGFVVAALVLGWRVTRTP